MKKFFVTASFCFCICAANAAPNLRDTGNDLADLVSLVEQRMQNTPIYKMSGEVNISDVRENEKVLKIKKTFELTVDLTSDVYKLKEITLQSPSHVPIGIPLIQAWDGKTYWHWVQIPGGHGPEDPALSQTGGLVTKRAEPYPATVIYDEVLGKSVAGEPLMEFVKLPNLQVVDRDSVVAGHHCVQLDAGNAMLWVDKSSGIMMQLDWYKDYSKKTLRERVQVQVNSEIKNELYPTHTTIETFDDSLRGHSTVIDVKVARDGAGVADRSDLQLNLPPGTNIYNADTKEDSYVSGRSISGGPETVEERLDVLVEKALENKEKNK